MVHHFVHCASDFPSETNNKGLCSFQKARLYRQKSNFSRESKGRGDYGAQIDRSQDRQFKGPNRFEADTSSLTEATGFLFVSQALNMQDRFIYIQWWWRKSLPVQPSATFSNISPS